MYKTTVRSAVLMLSLIPYLESAVLSVASIVVVVLVYKIPDTVSFPVTLSVSPSPSFISRLPPVIVPPVISRLPSGVSSAFNPAFSIPEIKSPRVEVEFKVIVVVFPASFSTITVEPLLIFSPKSFNAVSLFATVVVVSTTLYVNSPVTCLLDETLSPSSKPSAPFIFVVPSETISMSDMLKLPSESRDASIPLPFKKSIKFPRVVLLFIV